MSVEKSLVRFLAIDDTIAGVGVLVSENQILTCAHVIDRVLLRDKADCARKPDWDIDISFDFPLVFAGKQCQARITRWSSVKDDDIATLRIDEGTDLPSGISPTPLVPPHNEMWDKKVRAFGFPDETDDGVWAEGVLRGPQAKGWVHIDQPNSTGFAITRGFSGGPIWDAERKGVVGIVVAADMRGSRSSFMIPSTTLASMLPFEQMRGTLAWKLSFLRTNTLPALLDDLQKVEAIGLDAGADDGPECDGVKEILSKLVHSANDVGVGFMSTTIAEDFEQLEREYRDFNTNGGPAGKEHRWNFLNKLRKTRRQLSEKIRKAQPVLANELDDEMFENIYATIQDVCEDFPATFVNLRKSVRTFRKRKQASR